CLQKDRKLRLHDMTDVRIEIEEALSEPPMGRHVALVAPGRLKRAGWISALAIVSLVAVLTIVLVFRPAPAGREMRVDISTPYTADPVSVAISPDGEKIVFAGTVAG